MPSEPTRRVVIFDFDGVFVRRDSTATFMFRRLRRRPVRLVAAVVPGIAFLAVHQVPRVQTHLARALLRLTMWGSSEAEIKDELATLAREMATDPGVVIPPALSLLRDHLEQGDDVLVVSASFTDYLAAWFEAAGVDGVPLLGSGLRETAHGCVMDPHNHHTRKVDAVLATGRQDPWDLVYTDSFADLPLVRRARAAVLVDLSESHAAKVRALGTEARTVRWTAPGEHDPLTRE